MAENSLDLKAIEDMTVKQIISHFNQISLKSLSKNTTPTPFRLKGFSESRGTTRNSPVEAMQRVSISPEPSPTDTPTAVSGEVAAEAEGTEAGPGSQQATPTLLQPLAATMQGTEMPASQQAVAATGSGGFATAPEPFPRGLEPLPCPFDGPVVAPQTALETRLIQAQRQVNARAAAQGAEQPHGTGVAGYPENQWPPVLSERDKLERDTREAIEIVRLRQHAFNEYAQAS